MILLMANSICAQRILINLRNNSFIYHFSLKLFNCYNMFYLFPSSIGVKIFVIFRALLWKMCFNLIILAYIKLLFLNK
jgi:hypothetical protein